MASNGNIKGDDGVSVLVNDDVQALLTSTGGDFGRRGDEQVGDVVDSVSTLWAALFFSSWFIKLFRASILVSEV